MPSLVSKAAVAFLLFTLFSIVLAQDGYIGYHLEQRGDPESTTYETENTVGGVVLPADPDVYLNANVSVGEIDIEVDNITAKINLDAKVLSLLHFTAGVDLSIDRVKLSIQNVTAKVHLEARLGNVVAMIDDVLSSVDLNPIIATLSSDVGSIVGNVTDELGSADSTSTTTKRSVDLLDYNVQHNILYSINDYSGQTHTNRILGQNGTIYDKFINNDGDETGRRNVGYYSRDMSFTGHNRTITIDGMTEYEMGYMYAPYAGLEVYSHIFMTESGLIVKTKIVSEAEGGGTSTISDDADQ
ncbi:uncharacterized protein BCR38DRAFT_481869 [Pseudomassariella vexata]|uniref:Adhesin domain-containing protein n=1 Tax=Pseudomassariella vexata TaxID=1141098 RepID=A0A1Y2E9X2_9PEZI|nr:uncharacterized protein BCR38DRAFT_481869 [Pseudomassariella vexata]ORY68380.1 hypothetical protein BCR38DRAFT_481869 [Pseudomassariella vexata]